jgi:hypothetical protein
MIDGLARFASNTRQRGCKRYHGICIEDEMDTLKTDLHLHGACTLGTSLDTAFT